MENTVDARNAVEQRPDILYPVMLIAAIAVIVFSFAGIATMMGWLPGALSQGRLLERAASPARWPTAAEGSRAAAPAPAAACADDCGVIESIRAVDVKGEDSGFGDVGAGAYSGNEIEKNARGSVSYHIRVRMNDGTTRTFHERAQPALAVGQKVRVTGQGMNAAG
jgi:hypothetical protein